jgi:hypothetical protein
MAIRSFFARWWGSAEDAVEENLGLLAENPPPSTESPADRAQPSRLKRSRSGRRTGAPCRPFPRRAARKLLEEVPVLGRKGALLLVQIHRLDARQLARESPRKLQRDLHLWALSSIGRETLGPRKVPTHEELARWIAAAREQDCQPGRQCTG